MIITVFTPTYNRAHLLPRLYESLKAQTCKDFEWLIVDDGSTDRTELVVKDFIADNKIPIHYFKQENGGKHRAINHGVKEAQGELFFIVDSDDKLPPNSIKKTTFYYKQIKNDSRFAGISGLRFYFDGHQVGGDQPFDIIDCNMLDIRYHYHFKGDMAEVLRTDVMREFPFPEHHGERFCPEALVWNRISQKYIIRYFHENIYDCEYQPDGLTSKIIRIRMESPVASVMHYKELNSYNIPFKQKVKAAINYWRFHACVHKGKKVPKLPWYWIWCQPLGFFMHLKDKK